MPALRRRLCTELTQVTGAPSASSERCAPPPVASRTASATCPSSAEASTHTSAPNVRASSSAPAETSTATTLAPHAAAIITADRPTPPHPCTATHSPRRTLPCATTAR